MPGAKTICILSFGVIWLIQSCAIDKFIPEQKILLESNTVILKKSELSKRRVDRDQVRRVVPHPRYRLSKNYLHRYFTHSKPEDTTKFDRFILNKLSEKPVWYTPDLAQQGRVDLIKHLTSRGYYQSKVEYRAKIKGKQANVTYDVDPGPPLMTRSISYKSDNLDIQNVLDSLSPFLGLQPGHPLDEQILFPDQLVIIQALQDHGYYQVSKSSFDYFYSDSTGQKIDLSCNLIPPDGVSDFKKFTIREVNVYSTDRLTNREGLKDTIIQNIHYHYTQRPSIIKPKWFTRYLQFSAGQTYHYSNLQKSRTDFQNLGVYRSVTMYPEIMDSNSIRMNMFLPAVKKQYVQADFETSYVTNKDQLTGNKLIELRAILQYRHRNIFGGGEQFSVSATPSIGVQFASGKLYIPWGLNLQTGVTIPRFIDIGILKLANRVGLLPNREYQDIKRTARTRFNLATIYDLFLFYNKNTDLNERNTQQETRFSIGYDYSKENRNFYRYNPIGIDYLNYNLSDGFLSAAPEFYKRSFSQRFIGGLLFKEFSGDINKSLQNLNSLRLLYSIETSGIEAGIIDLFSSKTIFPKLSRYVRGDLDTRYTIKLSTADQIGIRVAAGLAFPFGESTNSVPFIRQFFVGGPNSIRGWAIREIGPGLYRNISNQSNKLSYYQTGNLKFEFGSEYRFDVFSYLKGAVLFDGGNVWLLKKDPSLPGGEISSKFLSQLYYSTGLGARFDFDYFLIRFDTGIKLRAPYLYDNGKHAPDLSLKNTQFNISLGLPF